MTVKRTPHYGLKNKSKKKYTSSCHNTEIERKIGGWKRTICLVDQT